jgi:hypothetical protein
MAVQHRKVKNDKISRDELRARADELGYWLEEHRNVPPWRWSLRRLEADGRELERFDKPAPNVRVFITRTELIWFRELEDVALWLLSEEIEREADGVPLTKEEETRALSVANDQRTD